MIQWSLLAKSSPYALGLILKETDIAGGLLMFFSCRVLCADANDLQRASNGRVYCDPMEQPPGGRAAGPAEVGRGGKEGRKGQLSVRGTHTADSVFARGLLS